MKILKTVKIERFEISRHPSTFFKIGALAIMILMGACAQSRSINKQIQNNLRIQTLKVNDRERRFALYLPNDLPPGLHPLVMELHGGGIYIEDMTGQSGHKTPYKLWMPLAERQKFIVVYPEGLNGAYGKPTWNDCRANARVNSRADDVQFLTRLIDTLTARYKIDKQRIYVSGTSNGGLMALRMAVERANKIAAVAAVAAAMPDTSECPPPQNPVSVLFMNGTADNHLPFKGGLVSNPPNPAHGSVHSVEASLKIWMDVDQTDTIPEIHRFPDLNKTDKSTVVRYSYLHGINNTQVVFYKIIGGGHSAPSIREQFSRLFEHYFGKQNHDIEMTTEVWNFFKDKTIKLH